MEDALKAVLEQLKTSYTTMLERALEIMVLIPGIADKSIVEVTQLLQDDDLRVQVLDLLDPCLKAYQNIQEVILGLPPVTRGEVSDLEGISGIIQGLFEPQSLLPAIMRWKVASTVIITKS